MKKFTKIIAASFMALTVGAFWGCRPNDNTDSGSTGPNSSDVDVVFDGFVNAEEINMLVGDQQTPTTNFSGLNVSASYESSAPNIVSVDQTGALTALRAGDATITLTYGAYKDTLIVHSSFGDYVPVLVFDESLQDSVIINKNEELNVAAHVFFNNKDFEANSVTYEILKEDGSVATADDAIIADGVFTAKKVGKYTVHLTAAWSNFTGQGLTKSIAIEANNAIELYINDGSKTKFGFSGDEIYTTASFDGKTWNNQIPFEIVAKNAGVAVTPTLNWKENADCVVYDETAKTLTGVKAGTVTLEIVYGKVKQVISVLITPVEAVYQGETIVFSAMDGTLPLEEIFGEEVELYSAYQIEDGEKTTEFEIKFNKVKGVDALVTKDGPAELTLLVSTQQAGYKINVKAYTKVIKNQSDLLNAFQLRTDNSTVDSYGRISVHTNEQSGYYILANDIEGNGLPYNVLSETVSYMFADPHKLGAKAQSAGKATKFYEAGHLHTGGLTGTFDGNGHTIKNIVISEYGLFGMVNGGTIKNVNIENASFVGRYGQMQTALGASLYNATLENVNISTQKIGGSCYKAVTENGATTGYASELSTDQSSVGAACALLAYTLAGDITMKNCVFTVPEVTAVDKIEEKATNVWPYSMGSLFCYVTGTQGEMSTFTTNLSGVYVISPVKLGYFLSGSRADSVVYAYDNSGIKDDYNSSYEAKSKAEEIAPYLIGFNRYADETAMQTANNDYSAFIQSGYWVMDENGLPVWNARPISFTVNGSDILEYTLYTQSSYAGNEYAVSMPFVVSGLHGTETITPDIEWISGAEYVTYNATAKTLTANGTEGVAVAKISYGGIIREVVITVSRPSVVYGETVLFSAQDGTLPVNEICGEDVTLVSVTSSDGSVLTVENNVISGITVDNTTGPKNLTLWLETETGYYEVNVKAYTKVIYNQADLLSALGVKTVARRNINGSQGFYDLNDNNGCYILANDIVGTGEVYDVMANATDETADEQYKFGSAFDHSTGEWSIIYSVYPNRLDGHTGGFTGIFDGNGYTIKNITIKNNGLFGMVNGGTIKNVNVENNTVYANQSYNRGLLAYSMNNAILENVRVLGAISDDYYKWDSTLNDNAGGWTETAVDYANNAWNRGFLAYIGGGSSTRFTNCIFECTDIEGTNKEHPKAYGSLFAYVCSGNSTATRDFADTNMTNTYVISNYALFVNGNTVHDASNMENASATKTYENVKRYETAEAMKTANGTYTAFEESGLWHLDENGLPAWGKATVSQ